MCVYLIEAHLAWQIANLLVLIFPPSCHSVFLAVLFSLSSDNVVNNFIIVKFLKILQSGFYFLQVRVIVFRYLNRMELCRSDLAGTNQVNIEINLSVERWSLSVLPFEDEPECS